MIGYIPTNMTNLYQSIYICISLSQGSVIPLVPNIKLMRRYRPPAVAMQSSSSPLLQRGTVLVHNTDDHINPIQADILIERRL